MRKRFAITLCTFFVLCFAAIGVNAASDGALYRHFKALIVTSDGNTEEMPVQMTIDEKGNEVYSFSQVFNENGEDYTVEGSYYFTPDNDVNFNTIIVKNPDGTINEDAIVISSVAHSDEEADVLAQLIEDLKNNDADGLE